MKLTLSIAVTLFSTSFAFAQNITAAHLAPGTTLPIAFEQSIDPGHARVGDVVLAKTTQQVRLANGETLPSGAHVRGHVLASNGFSFDKTPYAKQSPSTLSIQFESVEGKGGTLPLHVYVRALADPLTVGDAERPKATDLDPLSTTTQIGGDLVTPSQSEVESEDGETVGYRRRSGVYAHLVSAAGRGTDGCEGSDTEQSVGLFSASACGLYGYTDVTLLSTGKSGNDSTLTLTSRRHSAKIWAHSAALLEVASPSSSGMITQ